MKHSSAWSHVRWNGSFCKIWEHCFNATWISPVDVPLLYWHCGKLYGDGRGRGAREGGVVNSTVKEEQMERRWRDGGVWPPFLGSLGRKRGWGGGGGGGGVGLERRMSQCSIVRGGYSKYQNRLMKRTVTSGEIYLLKEEHERIWKLVIQSCAVQSCLKKKCHWRSKDDS